MLGSGLVMGRGGRSCLSSVVETESSSMTGVLARCVAPVRRAFASLSFSLILSVTVPDLLKPEVGPVLGAEGEANCPLGELSTCFLGEAGRGSGVKMSRLGVSSVV